MILEVLATDQEPLMPELDGDYFARAGLTVRTASDGTECLEQVRRYPPAILILDSELL